MTWPRRSLTPCHPSKASRLSPKALFVTGSLVKPHLAYQALCTQTCFNSPPLQHTKLRWNVDLILQTQWDTEARPGSHAERQRVTKIPILTCMPVPYLNKCLCKTPTQPSKPISKGSSSQRSQLLHQLTDPDSCFPSLPPFAEDRSTPLCLQLEGVSLAFPAPYLAPCLAQSGCPKRLLMWNQNGPQAQLNWPWLLAASSGSPALPDPGSQSQQPISSRPRWQACSRGPGLILPL